MNPSLVERIGAMAAGVIVAVVAFRALYQDWKTAGVENNVFKLMLFLLGVGAVIAFLAGASVIGYTKGA